MITETDKAAHPWPKEGRWIEWRWRKAVWPLIRPWYGYHNEIIPISAVRWFTPITFWFPFITWNIKIKGYGIHGYMGWKPLNTDDPGFYWNKLDIAKKWKEDGVLCVQGSIRGGINKIS